MCGLAGYGLPHFGALLVRPVMLMQRTSRANHFSSDFYFCEQRFVLVRYRVKEASDETWR